MSAGDSVSVGVLLFWRAIQAALFALAIFFTIIAVTSERDDVRRSAAVRGCTLLAIVAFGWESGWGR